MEKLKRSLETVMLPVAKGFEKYFFQISDSNQYNCNHDIVIYAIF